MCIRDRARYVNGVRASTIGQLGIANGNEKAFTIVFTVQQYKEMIIIECRLFIGLNNLMKFILVVVV